jgi:5-methylcytosine-specific restriction endonuclease McrA
MIHRKKHTDAPNELLDPKWDSIKDDVLVYQANHNEEEKCYRDTTISALIALYKNKCAICERERGLELHVDHYRPKKPRQNLTNAHYNQPGYYWLTYEWTNLIPLCSKCNQKKSNKFPLTGGNNNNRISSHININGIVDFNAFCFDWLQEYEKPLLVNPEYETAPERHFSFHRNGKMIGRTPEGCETIITYNLNRNDLIRERLKIREDYANRIKSAFDDFATSNNADELRGELKGIFKNIRQNCHIDSPYSLYHTYLHFHFNYFIDSKLPRNLRGQANKYYEQFKSV